MGRDSPEKVSRSRLVIGGTLDQPEVTLGDVRLRMGDVLPEGIGFDEGRLDERLVRTLAALALRRLEGAGWTSAEELALFVDGSANGGGGMAKFLERRLSEQATASRVIEFAARERDNADGRARGHRGGRSRGPYRLSAAGPRLVVDSDLCRSILVGRALRPALLATDTPWVHMASARDLVSLGRFPEAHRQASAAVARALARDAESAIAKPRDRAWALGEACRLLSNVEMEMGLFVEGLGAAGQARRLFTAIGHPEGEAHSLQLESHLLGQRELPGDALAALHRARTALHKLDNAVRHQRRGPTRASYVIVVGQRLSRVGQTEAAARSLAWAARAYLEGGVGHGACQAQLRLAQNALQADQLSAAARHIAEASELREHLTAAGKSLYARVSAEVLAALGDWDQAERWALDALSRSRDQGMRNEIERLKPILSAIEARTSLPRRPRR